MEILFLKKTISEISIVCDFISIWTYIWNVNKMYVFHPISVKVCLYVLWGFLDTTE